MTTRVADLTAKSGESVTPSIVHDELPAKAPVARIDTAVLAKKGLLVCGWILGLAEWVDSAIIDVGGNGIDLVRQAVPIPRPDVARHFSMEAGNDQHGFYALVELPIPVVSVDHLTLFVTLSSGEVSESLWPVSSSHSAAAAVEPYVAMLKELLPHLPRPEAKRLIEFAMPALGVPSVEEYLSPSQEAQFGIELYCPLESGKLIVAGWFSVLGGKPLRAQLRLGGSQFDLLENSLVFATRDMIPGTRARRDARFVSVCTMPKYVVRADEATFAFAGGTDHVHLTQLVSHGLLESHQYLHSVTGQMDDDSLLALVEYMAMSLSNGSGEESFGTLLQPLRRNAIERLPPSLQHENPRYVLHIDQVIPVAKNGLFLIGWFNSEPGTSVRIEWRCGAGRVVISQNWIRHVRADVEKYLATLGFESPDSKHGFSCYLPSGSGKEPGYLSVVTGSGETRRMRVSVPYQAESALQTVRALLGSFSSPHPDLQPLMQQHVGPAVKATWAARYKPSRQSMVRYYGTKPNDPAVSILVPLYGRHDFAEYQMALFASDPEFQNAELIYIIDDPAIFTEFNGRCADLYGIYRVPFLFVYPGTNLGFAGANNVGSEVARGAHLLLLNSDVLPKRPGWAGDLLRIYKTLPRPGLLGAKLLYEDGSIQHAGMAFRRYAGWGDLWINDHPLKGQSRLGLGGVREADAVTAACAMIQTQLYRELGGLSEDYIVGDFEDSDLCLRATSGGRQNYIALDVELYHLERQSQNRTGDTAWRTNLTLYNCWLHNERWGELIEMRTKERAAGAETGLMNCGG